jgi:two-component system, LytTR family, sensor histidine kinase AgrC
MFLRRLVERQLAAYQNGLFERYYLEVENMYRTMRGWRHDYRHHIQTLKAHMSQAEYTEVEKYLDMLDDDLTKVETVLRTGNRMADAILNSKLSLAKDRGITVKANASVPVEIGISELDLCVIIGNLLDNAIEACMDLPQDRRLIRIYVVMKGSHLYMSFSNTAAGGKKPASGGRFRSWKGEGHGLGLPRVDAIVKRYSGYITRASEEGAFSTEVLLPARS